jgi:hypothetical protein
MTLHADTEMLEYGDYCRRRRSPLELQRRGSARLEPVSEKTWSLAGRLIEFEDSGNGPVQRFCIKSVEDETPAVRRK